MRLVPLLALLAAVYVDVDALPFAVKGDGPNPDPNPEPTPNVDENGNATEGIPFDVLANAFDASGYTVGNRDAFLGNLVDAVRAAGGSVVGYPPPTFHGQIETRDDVSAILASALVGYSDADDDGIADLPPFTDAEVDAFLASLAASGFVPGGDDLPPEA